MRFSHGDPARMICGCSTCHAITAAEKALEP
jgi:hypothetical protein